MKEIHQLIRNPEFQNDIPKEGLDLFSKQDTYRLYQINLGITLNWYNELRENSQKEEFDLVADEIKTIDNLIEIAEKELNWKSPSTFRNIISSVYIQLRLKPMYISYNFRFMGAFARTAQTSRDFIYTNVKSSRKLQRNNKYYERMGKFAFI